MRASPIDPSGDLTTGLSNGTSDEFVKSPTIAEEEGSLRMGEIRVIAGTGQIRTLLGSCVGLALYHPSERIAGLAHIFLPLSDGKIDMPGRYVDTAVAEMIQLIREKAAKPGRLIAYVAGGARMFEETRQPTIGDLNSLAVEDELRRHAITVANRQCGGTIGRRMSIDAASGAVVIQNLAKSRNSSGIRLKR